MDDVITTVPVRDLPPEDLAAMLGALASSHQIDSPLCQRREQREHAALYLRGLLSRLERTSVEPMVLQVVGVNRKAVRNLPGVISLGGKSRALGEDAGVLMTDGSDFPKQGKESVGVKRPSCGPWGPHANGPAGVRHAG